MEEISYWIYTKQAPCLFNYDNIIKRQYIESKHINIKLKNDHNTHTVSVSPKKRKRKLSLLEESGSTEKKQNVYFEHSNQQTKTLISSCKSDTLGSDVDFNIKKSSKLKPKKRKLQKNTFPKKSKLVTSTPKVTPNVRKSLRRACKTMNLEIKNFETYDMYSIDRKQDITLPRKSVNRKTFESPKKAVNRLGNNKDVISKTNINGNYEEESDVSGFTANYIRSTKVPKAHRTRNKTCSRNLVRESKVGKKKSEPTEVCPNNTTVELRNCSTDLSHIMVSLDPATKEDKSSIDKSTLLKFIDTKCKVGNKNSHNVTSQTINTSRYPKRYKNNSTDDFTLPNLKLISSQSKGKSRRSDNRLGSDRKENPNDRQSVLPVNSRKIVLHKPEKSVLVLSNSTDQLRPDVPMDVAECDMKDIDMKHTKRVSKRSRRALDKSSEVRKDSLRDKSGFSACFSESDEERPLKQQRYFC